MISCRKISKCFGRAQVFNNLSIDFPAGNCLLTGPNGSGKSTLLMLIAGLETLDSGQILFLDQERESQFKISIATDAIAAPDSFTLSELFKLQSSFNSTNEQLFNHQLFSVFVLLMAPVFLCFRPCPVTY